VRPSRGTGRLGALLALGTVLGLVVATAPAGPVGAAVPTVVGSATLPSAVVLGTSGSAPFTIDVDVSDDTGVASVSIGLRDPRGSAGPSAAASLRSGSSRLGRWRSEPIRLRLIAATGRWAVTATVCDAAPTPSCGVVALGAITVVLATYVAGERATPERIVSGQKLVVRGRLMRLGATGTYTGYSGAFVDVELRRAGQATWAKVRRVRLSSTGRATVPLTARSSGAWRVRYAGSATFAASVGDAATVEVSPVRSRVFGRSVEGRALRVRTIGDPNATRRVLVVGSIHGNESAGRAVITRLRRTPPPRGVAYVLVTDLNPDGTRAGTRQNARGVDLNRNFPVRWTARGPRWSTYHAGPRALSESESRAAHRLIRRVRPTTTIWYHQAMNLVDPAGGPLSAARDYARTARARVERLTRYGGSVATWQQRRAPSRAVLVVELGPRVSNATERRHVRAVARVARR
jgi:murein peptide amidase A